MFSTLHVILRTDQEKVGCQGNHQMGDAYYVCRRYMQQPHDNFFTNAADNTWFVALVTNRTHNVHRCTEKCFSYRSNPFEIIMKIEQNIGDLMIRGSRQSKLGIMGKYKSFW